MAGNARYSSYAVLYELNNRELRKKLDLFPEELRYYAILANSIIGAENAQRVEGTPQAVVEDGVEFVSKLLGMASPGQDDTFREILEKYLIETMKDELRSCCPNCTKFNACLDIENLEVGNLFERRAQGEETGELKKEIALQVADALKGAPYIDTDDAHTLCKDFKHQYTVSNMGEIFGRYSDIAAELRNSFGIDYKRIQEEMISINMDFCRRNGEVR